MKKSPFLIIPIVAFWLAVPSIVAAPSTRPNIVVVIADDWGWGHAGVLGAAGIKTPHFDRVAREGALFLNAYCPSPSCSPSRASLLTGQMFYRLGEGANLAGRFDAKFPVYPDLLEAQGYAVGLTGKGWAPGYPEESGWTRNPAGPLVESFSEFVDGLPEDQPLVYWFGSTNPHRPFDQSHLAGSVDSDAVTVPAFLPDTPEVRADVVNYFEEVQDFDRQLGEILAVLEKSGRLENTLIVVTSDNGMPFPRAKLNLYDSGTRMPMAMRWGGRIKPGTVVDHFVSLADLAPTFLAAAGEPIPPEMTGRDLRPLIESGTGARDFVVTGRERHNVSYFPGRAIRTKDYLYIRNYQPENPIGLGDPGPTRTFLSEHRGNPEVDAVLARAVGPRPPEELYDVNKDPDQFENLAARPEWKSVKEELAKQLDAYLVATQDPRALGVGEVFDSYPNRIKKKATQKTEE